MVDLIGGSVHSGIDAYRENNKRERQVKAQSNREELDDEKKWLASLDPPLKAAFKAGDRETRTMIMREKAASNKRLDQMRKDGYASVVEGYKAPPTYEQALAAAAAAKHPSQRKEAALAALAAANRPRSARWSERLAGAPEEVITKQVDRMYPEEYRAPKPTAPRGPGPRHAAVNPAPVGKLFADLSKGTEVGILRAAQSLRNKGGYKNDGKNPDPNFFVLVPDPRTPEQGGTGKLVLATKEDTSELTRMAKAGGIDRKAYLNLRVARANQAAAFSSDKRLNNTMFHLDAARQRLSGLVGMSSYALRNNQSYKDGLSSVTDMGISENMTADQMLQASSGWKAQTKPVVVPDTDTTPQSPQKTQKERTKDAKKKANDPATAGRNAPLPGKK